MKTTWAMLKASLPWRTPARLALNAVTANRTFTGVHVVPLNQERMPTVVLMGMRCSGKSHIGGLLAQRLQRPFIDLDLETMRAFADCRTISDVWRTHGEEAFRAVELVALQRALNMQNGVIALGGGSPISLDGQRALAAARKTGNTFTVYLQASASVLRERLLLDDNAHRPPLLGESPLDEVDDLLAAREPIYTRMADFMVNATLPPQDIVECIVREYPSHVEHDR